MAQVGRAEGGTVNDRGSGQLRRFLALMATLASVV
jgi:hypothetical protein